MYYTRYCVQIDEEIDRLPDLDKHAKISNLPTESQTHLIDEISGGGGIMTEPLRKRRGPRRWAMAGATILNHVDDCCFVSKSPGGKQVECAGASRVPPDDLFSPGPFALP